MADKYLRRNAIRSVDHAPAFTSTFSLASLAVLSIVIVTATALTVTVTVTVLVFNSLIILRQIQSLTCSSLLILPPPPPPLVPGSCLDLVHHSFLL